MKYPLAVSSWGDEEVEAITKVVESKKLSMGDRVKQFEHEFAEYHNVKYAVMVNSGSSANLLGAEAFKHCGLFDIKKGDEVIVPAVGWSTTFFPFHQTGFELAFVDVDEELNIDIDKIKQRITKRTRAICAVNVMGNPCRASAIKKICEDNPRIQFIEDNCEALGAHPFDSLELCGTHGLYGTFSFFFSHHIQTIEGGMLITDSKELYETALVLRAHGWIRDLPKDNSIYPKTDNYFEESWKFVLPGYNLRPSEINGVLGSCQLQRLDGFLRQRRENAKVYKGLFGKESFCKIVRPPKSSSWFSFPFILDGDLKGKRDIVMDVFSQHHIDTRPIVSGNFINNPVIKKLNCTYKMNMNCADEIESDGFVVGNNHKNLEVELTYLYDVFQKARRIINER